VERFFFQAAPVKSTDPLLARAQFLTLKGTHAWPFRLRTNQFPVIQADCLFFPVLASEFLHKFMPILSVEICLRLGPLHAVFASASGLLSHDPLHR
jgi:hypothetical protein